ncbi:MAG: ABC transporter permease [Chthonomonadales bacterium]
MAHRALIIAQHEYITNVRRKEFLLVTLGLPVFLLVVMGISMLSTGMTIGAATPRNKPLGVVDHSGALSFPSAGTWNPPVEVFSNEDEGLQAVRSGRLRALIVVAADYLASGKVEIYQPAGPIFSGADIQADGVLTRALLAKTRIPPSIVERVTLPTGRHGPSVYTWDAKAGRFSRRTGAGEAARFLVPYGFGMMLIMAVFISANYLLRSVADEKENRVIEVILSSVTASDLLTGKLIGLAGVGLTQVGAWVLMAALPALLLFHRFVRIPPAALGMLALYFILGFGLYATLMAGIGALGTSYRESQQIASVVSFMAFSPFFVLMPILQSPNGVLAQALSYFPFTAPLTMVLRSSAGEIPAYQSVVAVLLMALTIRLIHRLSVRLFRFGLLIYGKRPSFAETVRWLREAQSA